MTALPGSASHAWWWRADYIESCNCAYGCPCNTSMLPTHDGGPAHHPVGPEDGSGLAVDRQAPAGVIRLGQDDDPGVMQPRAELDPLGLAPGDRH